MPKKLTREPPSETVLTGPLHIPRRYVYSKRKRNMLKMTRLSTHRNNKLVINHKNILRFPFYSKFQGKIYLYAVGGGGRVGVERVCNPAANQCVSVS